MELILQLFATFFVMGLVNFGGGGAMLSLIQTEVVTRHAWISEAQFTDIVAISQTTPGPVGINCATYVGYEVGGIAGSAAATLALILPSLLVFFVIMHFYARWHRTRAWSSAMGALRPVVAGLIGAAALVLMYHLGFGERGLECSVLRENFPDWKSWLLCGGAVAASLAFKVNPILLILIGAVAGFFLY